jgi:ribosomal protein S18 acetylase RimI-like enzyme
MSEARIAAAERRAARKLAAEAAERESRKAGDNQNAQPAEQQVRRIMQPNRHKNHAGGKEGSGPKETRNSKDLTEPKEHQPVTQTVTQIPATPTLPRCSVPPFTKPTYPNNRKPWQAGQFVHPRDIVLSEFLQQQATARGVVLGGLAGREREVSNMWEACIASKVWRWSTGKFIVVAYDCSKKTHQKCPFPVMGAIQFSHTGCISVVAVLTACRGRRVAKLLMAVALEHIGRHGAECADLYVSCRELKKCPHLHHLYESIGFTRGPHSEAKGGCYKTASAPASGIAEKILLAGPTNRPLPHEA